MRMTERHQTHTMLFWKRINQASHSAGNPVDTIQTRGNDPHLHITCMISNRGLLGYSLARRGRWTPGSEWAPTMIDLSKIPTNRPRIHDEKSDKSLVPTHATRMPRCWRHDGFGAQTISSLSSLVSHGYRRNVPQQSSPSGEFLHDDG